MIFNFLKPDKNNAPQKVQKVIFDRFPKAINIEWHQHPNLFEAVFYLDEVEHIAGISPDGKLVSYKKNLKINDLPEIIKSRSQAEGEIMSAISHHSSEGVRHEIIIRKIDFSRYLLLFNDDNVLTEIRSV